MKRLRLAIIGLLAVTGTLAAPGWAQHEHHGPRRHRVAAGAKLEIGELRAGNLVTLRIGPLNLPAHSDHYAAEQPADMFWTVPFDGWLVAYRPAVTNENGDALPGRLLHHVGFYHTARPDFLCPNKPEHIFGAGGELNDWPEVPGFGYRVRQGERVRINTMFHNPTDTAYPRMYLSVHVEIQRENDGTPRRNVYPAWFDVQECGRSGYDLQPGKNVTSGEFELRFTGLLLGVGGHLHDHGQALRLENATRNEEVAKLESKLDAAGRIQSMPVITFADRGGYPLRAGERIRVTATYQNPTGRPLPEGAMGIVVGYFLPREETQLVSLRRRR